MSVVPGAAVLRVENLRVDFRTPGGRVNVLDGISFEVGESEVVGLMGESGAGKSVLADTLLAVTPCPPGEVSGRVLYRGRDLLALPEAELQKIRGNEIAMIVQDPTSALNPVFRVGLQVAEPLEIHKGEPRRSALRRVVELFTRVGIPSAASRVQNYPHQFSGGMRQRVIISMGIGTRPRLLVADEPTSSLDVTIQAQILDLVRGLVAELRTAVLFIFHDLAVISHLCDRVMVLYAGQLVEEGPVAEVLGKPQHPYTQGLLRSIPRLGARRLEPIPGTPPTVQEYLPGCRFHPRCQPVQEYLPGCRFHPRCPHPEKDAHCAAAKPALLRHPGAPVGAPHHVACWKVR